ncbi:MAG: hypothetical protein JJE37_11570 [Methyloceanibacter sp.]|nr:hypothetical protein [Methyloceanibacter sp.]
MTLLDLRSRQHPMCRCNGKGDRQGNEPAALLRPDAPEADRHHGNCQQQETEKVIYREAEHQENEGQHRERG